MRRPERFLAALLAGPLLLAAPARGQTYQSKIAEPIVRYKMAARLDPATKTVKGHYVLRWWNHTTDTIPDLYFHLYLNAFKNTDSTFMREGNLSRRPRRRDSWTAQPEKAKWGWVDVDRIRIVDGPDLTGAKSFVHPDDDNALDQTVLRVALPKPIPPKGAIELEVDFTSKLPKALARTGYEGDYFFVVQWFPKIGVYEGSGERGRILGGWNCHQFHANTEFYADYGVYDVELTVPSNYVVGATGYRRRDHRSTDGTTTYNYYQEDVHDFAWTASPHFITFTRTFDWGREVRADELVACAKILNLSAEEMALRNVSVTLLLQPDHSSLADRYFRAAFNGLKYFGLWYGQYPYDTLTVVDPPRDSHTGGMEYPTLFTGGTDFWPGRYSLDPEGVTVHEFGHQFWYGLVGNNEFEESWLDEGFTVYSTGKVIETAYPIRTRYRHFFGIPVPVQPWFDVKIPSFPFAGVRSIPLGSYFSWREEAMPEFGRGGYLADARDDAIVRNGWEYLNGESYGTNSYIRTALTLQTLERYLGADTMARVMRTYQQRWRYRHPCTQDFIAVVNEVSGQNMDWFFKQFFYSSQLTDYAVTNIINRPVEGKIGIYDEGNKKVTYVEKDAAGTAAKQGKRFRSTVVVRRVGEVIVPVDVLVHFENGETVLEHWDGQYRWIKFEYEKSSPVSSAEVDPARKLILDANFTNNSWVIKEDNRAAARWYVRWIFWLENLFFTASFFS